MTIWDPKAITLNDQEKAFVQRAYGVVNQIASEVRVANFHLTVHECETQFVFHEMVACIKSSGILPGIFAGLNCMAICGNQIRDFAGGKGDARMEGYLIGVIRKDFGDEISDVVKSWMDGTSQARKYKPVTGNSWEKLGAMAYMIPYVGLFCRIADSMEKEDNSDLAKVISDFNVTAESCKGAFPSFDVLYEQKISRLKSFLEPSPAPALLVLPGLAL